MRGNVFPPVDEPPARSVRGAVVAAIGRLSKEDFSGAIKARIKAARAWYERERESIK